MIRRSGTFRLGVACCVLLCALGLAAPFAAQSPPAATGDELTLIEAVRLALLHDPNLRFQEAAVRLQRGVLQEQRGAFDPTLAGALGHQFGQTALDDTTRESEEETRTNLDDDITTLESEQVTLETSRDETLALQEDPLNNTVSNTALQTRVDVINALLVEIEDPDTLTELEDLRTEQITDELTSIESDLSKNIEDLAETLEDRRKLGDVPSGVEQYLATFDLTYAIPQRNGTTWTGFLDFEADGQNFIGKQRNTEYGGQGIQDFYDATIGIRFDAALGAGRGLRSTGAAERAEEIDYAASLATLRHVAAQRVLFAAQTYWALVGAQERAGIFRRSTELQDRLVEISRALIESGELAPMELSRALARRADARGDLDAANRALHTARVDLVDALGLEARGEDVRGAVLLPSAGQSFPAPPPSASLDAALDAAPLSDWLDRAVERRDDLAAARLQRDSGQVLELAAEIDLAPTADLQLEFSANSIEEDSSIGDALEETVGGKWTTGSGKMSFDFAWTPANNDALGELEQAAATKELFQIRARELERSIRSEVVLARENLRSVAVEAALASESVAAYQEVVEDELEKLRHGVSTVQDVILSEESLTSARLSELSLRQLYWQFLARWRFVLGDLVVHDAADDEQSATSRVVEADLLTLPTLGARR